MFNQAPNAEDRRVAMILCPHAICPQGYGTWELSGYISSRTHYSRFLDGSLLYMYVPWGLVWKVEGQVFLELTVMT